MAKYVYENTKTGATFETDVQCAGGSWQLKESADTKAAKPAEVEGEPKEPKKGKKESK